MTFFEKKVEKKASKTFYNIFCRSLLTSFFQLIRVYRKIVVQYEKTLYTKIVFRKKASKFPTSIFESWWWRGWGRPPFNKRQINEYRTSINTPVGRVYTFHQSGINSVSYGVLDGLRGFWGGA